MQNLTWRAVDNATDRFIAWVPAFHQANGGIQSQIVTNEKVLTKLGVNLQSIETIQTISMAGNKSFTFSIQMKDFEVHYSANYHAFHSVGITLKLLISFMEEGTHWQEQNKICF